MPPIPLNLIYLINFSRLIKKGNKENKIAPGYIQAVCCPFRAQPMTGGYVTQGVAIGLGYFGLSVRGGAMKNVCYNIKCPP
jgi:hypothetical protein